MIHSNIQICLEFILPILIILTGFIVIFRKAPVIIDYRWYLLFMALLFVTIGFNSLFILKGTSFIFPLIIIAALLLYMYIFKKGYLVIGANGEDLYRVLIEILNEGNYEFEQTETTIIIKEPRVEIGLNLSFLGSGMIRIKKPGNMKTFHSIIDLIKNRSVKTKLFMPIFYIAFSILLISFNIVRLFW